MAKRIDFDSVNLDESLVPEYTLPDPLLCAQGNVANQYQWEQEQRPELLNLFAQNIYGVMPPAPTSMRYEVFGEKLCLNGTAIQRQVSVYFTDESSDPSMDLLIYLPVKTGEAVPILIGLNFFGNHTIDADEDIRLSTGWIRSDAAGVIDNRATQAARGTQSDRWPLEEILQRGYGVATAYSGDLDPDFDDGFFNGIHPLFNASDHQGRSDSACGAIGAWAWGLSRCMDYFTQAADIDDQQIAVIGHSRLGKAALWAAATDERFALVISNQSGCGGAALSRRCYGERIEHITQLFPHWFCKNLEQFSGKEDSLPVDQHMLIALIAPRPVYVASALEDQWADPKGEFLSALHANPVYRLFDLQGLPTQTMPAVNTPILGDIGYHIREGKHGITLYDWQQYLNFVDMHFRR